MPGASDDPNKAQRQELDRQIEPLEQKTDRTPEEEQQLQQLKQQRDQAQDQFVQSRRDQGGGGQGQGQGGGRDQAPGQQKKQQ